MRINIDLYNTLSSETVEELLAHDPIIAIFNQSHHLYDENRYFKTVDKQKLTDEQKKSIYLFWAKQLLEIKNQGNQIVPKATISSLLFEIDKRCTDTEFQIEFCLKHHFLYNIQLAKGFVIDHVFQISDQTISKRNLENFFNAQMLLDHLSAGMSDTQKRLLLIEKMKRKKIFHAFLKNPKEFQNIYFFSDYLRKIKELVEKFDFKIEKEENKLIVNYLIKECSVHYVLHNKDIIFVYLKDCSVTQFDQLFKRLSVGNTSNIHLIFEFAASLGYSLRKKHFRSMISQMKKETLYGFERIIDLHLKLLSFADLSDREKIETDLQQLYIDGRQRALLVGEFNLAKKYASLCNIPITFDEIYDYISNISPKYGECKTHAENWQNACKELALLLTAQN